MTPELVPLCTIELQMGETLVVGEGAAGLRVVAQVASGTLRGDRLRGEVVGPSTADWIRVHDGMGIIDVRATLRTHDGAVVYATYGGRMDLSEGPGAAPVYVAPTFETGHPDYAWLNGIQAVGVGRLDGERLHYEWFELRSV